jgi:hypothetical protein
MRREPPEAPAWTALRRLGEPGHPASHDATTPAPRAARRLARRLRVAGVGGAREVHGVVAGSLGWLVRGPVRRPVPSPVPFLPFADESAVSVSSPGSRGQGSRSWGGEEDTEAQVAAAVPGPPAVAASGATPAGDVPPGAAAEGAPPTGGAKGVGNLGNGVSASAV